MNHELQQALQALLGNLSTQCTHITPLKGGSNNRLWRVETPAGVFCLKQYVDDERPRQEIEWQFLHYARQLGLKCVAQPLTWDRAQRLTLLSWIPGEPVQAGTVTAADVEAQLQFWLDLNPTDTPPLWAQPASDACFSLQDHLHSVHRRIQALAALTDPTLQHLVQTELQPLWSQSCDLLALEKAPAAPFHPSECWLSPSDTGFHNVLRSSRGNLYFLDFEYAGRDHCLKTLADFYTSVGIPVPAEYLHLALPLLERLPDPPTQWQRLLRLLPLHQLKWCCILMGVFLPNAAMRRAFIGFTAQEWQAEQRIRIEAALYRTRYWLEQAQEY